jgi:hypothetical protein
LNFVSKTKKKEIPVHYDEFMHKLCHIVSQFSIRVTDGDPGPCICRENGTWYGSEVILRALAAKLEVDFDSKGE